MKSKKGHGKMGNLKKIIIPVALLLLATAVFYYYKNVAAEKKPSLKFQKGMGYVSWSKEGYVNPESDKSLEAMRRTGTEYVSILVTWYQSNCSSRDIQRTDITPSDESLIHAIRKAHELGMKVMLKPHLDLLDTSDGSWRGEIGCTKEEDWKEWFAKYTDYIMYYAEMAQKEKVELYCVGTELSTTDLTKGYMWKELIAKVRTKYSGALTYAAHWDTYADIRFWEDLDYVGVNAYFPLTEKMDPTYEELKAGWDKWVAEMEEFQKQVNKPIIFPESGCNSCDGAAIRPWEHSPRREVNLLLQENYYKVLFDVFYGKEWFYGMYWWYWGTSPNMGGKYNRGFTPQNKPSEDVVKEWYAKTVPQKMEFGNK